MIFNSKAFRLATVVGMVNIAKTYAFVSGFPKATVPIVRRAMSMAADNDFDDYSAKTAFFFPGQGAQYVGMAGTVAAEVPKAKELFDKASEILGYDLLERCTNGPKEVLDSTAVSQPAIFVSSMAAIEKMKAEGKSDIIDSATCAMGLSLGEYSALCFAGALSFEDGVKVTKARGEAMQAASDVTPTGMVSVIGLDSGKVSEICKAAAEKSGEPVQIANYLCKGNYAVSGAIPALDVVQEIAKPEYKARMTVRLAVAGAFHTDFMAPAVEKLGAVLDSVEISKPKIPVISNVDAKPHSDPSVIKEILKKQVTNPVLWENTVAELFEHGYEQGYECGPGKVIAGIIKRINKAAVLDNVEV
mmetsp:Transcript_2096/g.3058  ORF Transcript_2096/g.3058 Transcript_2096/m.3058 type:complete len:359 (-) Transcript_2096:68-1144(-)|eukprot:CAMPEP_0113943184 /NCGR_PEP_ID=MMETSP1339-20121228/19839_1 /TAXON_ID=94617 /ORGANISM="Fibrocapsa japonica" /LENGTH=358 /DNA_ID=CAMNT_0000947987 /DNA_START=107 /DNA_END=1183 /DNA_ORIENTATION=- /assembly_acc=CAM_ASM_000762